jgi:hypothetical protein
MEAVRDRGGDLFSIGTHHHHQILVPAWARLGPGMPKRDNDMKLESKQRVLTFTMLPFLIDFGRPGTGAGPQSGSALGHGGIENAIVVERSL